MTGRTPIPVKVLRQLARNPVQQDVKAIFFVQTRHPKRGGSAEGRAMLAIEHAEGHLLGLHTGTPRGHVRPYRHDADGPGSLPAGWKGRPRAHHGTTNLAGQASLLVVQFVDARLDMAGINFI